MAEDLEYIAKFGDETYTQDEIDGNREETLELEKINQNSTIKDMIKTIDANFRTILRSFIEELLCRPNNIAVLDMDVRADE